MSDATLPWEVVETTPVADPTVIATWRRRAAVARTDRQRARALVGVALARYWDRPPSAGSVPYVPSAPEVDEAIAIARSLGDPDLLAEALLGELHARWGPDHLLHGRTAVLGELSGLRPLVSSGRLRLRVQEWTVLAALDAGDVAAAWDEVIAFERAASDLDEPLVRRRSELWRANLATLEGRLDEGLRRHQEAVSSTAALVGSPFAFQNRAVTVAIERYLRRGLADVVDAVRSVRASSPRVAVNWDAGLAFTLAEIGELAAAAELFEPLASDGFIAVSRDLNWLVTMVLLGLTALRLDHERGRATTLALLRPFAAFDATHGSGYASYGPVARVVGSLAASIGDQGLADDCFGLVASTRQAGPWTALAMLDQARAHAAAGAASAAQHAAAAERALRRSGMEAWAAEARRLAGADPGRAGAVAQRHGSRWSLRHPTGSAEVPDGVGVRMLLHLLERAGQPVAAVALEAARRPAPPPSASGARLDRPARAAFTRRLADLEGVAGADAAAERQELRRTLRGPRQVPADPELERARIRVTKALRRAVDAVGLSSPALGAHLIATLDTGRTCLYRPPDGSSWRVIEEVVNT